MDDTNQTYDSDFECCENCSNSKFSQERDIEFYCEILNINVDRDDYCNKFE